MKFLSKYIYDSAMTPLKRRALAFAICVKTYKPASVLKDMSYRQIADLVGTSHQSCSNYIKKLKDMKLVEENNRNGHHYFIFKSLRAEKKKNRHSIGYHRPKFAEIDISKLDMRSVASVETGLMAMLFVETQINKDLAKQLVESKQNPRKISAYKRSSAICCKRSYGNFVDDGISYKYIASNLHCSYSTVSKVIQHGEKIGLFMVEKSAAIYVEGPDIRCADEIWNGEKLVPVHYRCGNKAYHQPANRFVLSRAFRPRLSWI